MSMHTSIYFAVVAIALFGAALLFPDNGISGYVIREPSCGELGCSELCDVGGAVCSDTNEICCATDWGSGVCGLESDCSTIAEYSERMSLTQYQDTVRETPGAVSGGWARFVFPLVVVLALATMVVLQGRDKKREAR